MLVLRISYGGGTRRQMLVEGAICGGWAGFLDVEKIRTIADRVTDFKLPSRKPEQVVLTGTPTLQFVRGS